MSASVIPQPYQLPHSCASCGYAGTEREKWLDTGIQIEYFGAIYFCNLCFSYLADLMGFTSGEAIESLKREYSVVVAAFEISEQKVEMLTEAIRNLERADIHVVDAPVDPDISGLRTELSDVEDSDEDNVSSFPADPEPPNDPRGGQEDVGAGEGTVDESSNDESLAGIRTDGEQPPRLFSI